jgi:RNA polymerase sigma-70 factor, ECF subfamily
MHDLLPVIQRARHGDEAAFTELVAATHLEVACCIAALLSDRQAAEEVLHETYAAGFSQLAQWREEAPFAVWLKGIARNLVRRELRRRRNLVPLAAVENDVADPNEIQREAEALTLSRLNHCLDQLPPRARLLLDARYRDGEELTRLAQRFKDSTAQIAKQLWRIRQGLRACIERGQV